MFHSIEEAIEDLKNGKMIVIVDDEDRENEGDLLALSEKATPEIINFMITHAKGLVCCPITKERADKLELEPMVQQNTDSHQTAFTVSVDHITNTTGISAPERTDTIQALVADDAIASDFKRPGHIFPLVAKEGGVLEREGHTEAAVDLAKLCGASPSGIICEIIKEDGTMARLPELEMFAKTHQLKLITIADLIKYRQSK
ncbi:Riboflavin biosynthesis protein RibBA [Halalkalibacter krulwichiae]|uniref:3,4-dihydroxy-2-butanone 4-phosphate synthase n=1 Tax=Halalkalibacter krulwichiae TaxID=199441 RepID=A0A1X9ML30_9BACI|nr:Riboflavin biosynthesis protein RibBA [Halalkalibacter krulwichiae]